MPVADFGKDLNLPSTPSVFIKLTSKGDKIKFRIADVPVYDTKHFVGDKQIEICGKYNSDDPKAKCQWCDKWQERVKAGDKDGARAIAPVTTFYYRVLDLKENRAGVFQFNAKSIHYTIKNYADEGADVFQTDWVVERTEEPGSYYKILSLPGKPLNEEQMEQMDIAKNLKLTVGRESSSVGVTEKK